MIDTSYGTTMVAESFTGATNTFDLYSTPLSSAMDLLAGDTGNVAVWINNAGGADIMVNVSAAFFDYDSGTGSQMPLVTTGTATATINAGNPMKVSTGPGAGLGAGYTIPVGHQLKATIEIDVISGTATDGRLQYGATLRLRGRLDHPDPRQPDGDLDVLRSLPHAARHGHPDAIGQLPPDPRRPHRRDRLPPREKRFRRSDSLTTPFKVSWSKVQGPRSKVGGERWDCSGIGPRSKPRSKVDRKPVDCSGSGEDWTSV